jgi:hypothetical protein
MLARLRRSSSCSESAPQSSFQVGAILPMRGARRVPSTPEAHMRRLVRLPLEHAPKDPARSVGNLNLAHPRRGAGCGSPQAGQRSRPGLVIQMMRACSGIESRFECALSSEGTPGSAANFGPVHSLRAGTQPESTNFSVASATLCWPPPIPSPVIFPNLLVSFRLGNSPSLPGGPVSIIRVGG